VAEVGLGSRCRFASALPPCPAEPLDGDRFPIGCLANAIDRQSTGAIPLIIGYRDGTVISDNCPTKTRRVFITSHALIADGRLPSCEFSIGAPGVSFPRTP
jgi:hypothetical protein